MWRFIYCQREVLAYADGPLAKKCNILGVMTRSHAEAMPIQMARNNWEKESFLCSSVSTALKTYKFSVRTFMSNSSLASC